MNVDRINYISITFNNSDEAENKVQFTDTITDKETNVAFNKDKPLAAVLKELYDSKSVPYDGIQARVRVYVNAIKLSPGVGGILKSGTHLPDLNARAPKIADFLNSMFVKINNTLLDVFFLKVEQLKIKGRLIESLGSDPGSFQMLKDFRSLVSDFKESILTVDNEIIFGRDCSAKNSNLFGTNSLHFTLECALREIDTRLESGDDLDGFETYELVENILKLLSVVNSSYPPSAIPRYSKTNSFNSRSPF